MTPEQIAAFDLSLTSTGYACADGVGVFATKLRGVDRLAYLRDRVMAVAGPTIDVAVIEGYAVVAGRGNSIALQGELGGVVRVALAEQGIAIVDVAPSCLKRYATGKGNASKDEVFAEAIRRLGYQGSSNDEADAVWLYTMACDALAGIRPDVPELNRKALDVVTWPASRRVA